MPTLLAALLATVVEWLFDDLLGRHLPLVLRILAGLVVSTLAFFYARRRLTQLREDMR